MRVGICVARASYVHYSSHLTRYTPYNLTENILRPRPIPIRLAAMMPRLHIIIAPSSSWGCHVSCIMSHRNLPHRTVDEPSDTSAAEKTARLLRSQASSLTQTFTPWLHLNPKPATCRLTRTIKRGAIDARFMSPSRSGSVLYSVFTVDSIDMSGELSFT